jgi:hypothetical protein
VTELAADDAAALEVGSKTLGEPERASLPSTPRAVNGGIALCEAGAR